LVASPQISFESPISIDGTVDDSSEPLKLKIVQFKPVD